jgi:hypothetical protein
MACDDDRLTILPPRPPRRIASMPYFTPRNDAFEVDVVEPAELLSVVWR